VTDISIQDLARLAAESPAETDDLYHYTSATVGLDSILTQMQVRLGLLEATNDPRESRPRYPNLSVAHGVPHDDVQDVWKEADLYLRRSAKVVCLTIDYALPDWALEVNRLRGYAHPALWAHYGARHSGVCLRFSRRSLGERIRDASGGRGQLFEGPVRYSSEAWRGRVNAEGFDLEQINEFGIDAVVSAYIDKHHEELFFRKHDDWSSESEYRWVAVEARLTPIYVDIGGALTGIVLGDAFPADRVRAVHDLAERSGGIEVSQVRFHNGGVIRAPSSSSPASVRPHRRSGTLSERLSALTDAEAEASRARARAQAFTAPLVARLQEFIERIRDTVGPLPGVRVEMLSRALAIPPPDRARKPGVPTYGSEYDAGKMLVLTNESPQIEFLAGVGVQSLTGNRLRFHAMFTTRDLGSPEPESELWRIRRESGRDLTDAEALLDEITEQMLNELPEALEAFDVYRRERQP
jgi:Protein of unknown function (DUF2971)